MPRGARSSALRVGGETRVMARRWARSGRAIEPGRAWAHAISITLLVFGVALRFHYLVCDVHTPDEDTYANFYARPLEVHGLRYLSELNRRYDAQPSMHEFPRPTRIGYLIPMVGFLSVSDAPDLTAAATLSTAASVATLLLIYGVGTMLDPWVAPIALLFAVVSPLDLAMSRRVWPDSLMGFCAMLLAWWLTRALAQPGRMRAGIAALAAGAYAVMVKETGLFLLGFATGALAIAAWRAGGSRGAIQWLAGGLAALILAAAATAFACGGIEPVRSAVAALRHGAPTNAYMREYQTGDLRYYARGLALLQPVPIALGLVGATLALKPLSSLFTVLRGRAVTPALATLGWMSLTVGAAIAVLPQKNMRFLSPVYPALDLLAAAVIVGGLRQASARLPRAAGIALFVMLAIGLLAAGYLDQARFVRYFITGGIADLATPWFFKAAP